MSDESREDDGALLQETVNAMTNRIVNYRAIIIENFHDVSGLEKHVLSKIICTDVI